MNAINAIVDEMKNLQLEGKTVSLVALSIDDMDIKNALEYRFSQKLNQGFSIVLG